MTTAPTDFEAPEMTGPTFDDPTRGLEHLPAVALIGRARIHELASAPVPYVWEHVSVRGTITSLSGKPGGGKTTALFLVLAARANTGEPVSFLSHVVTPAPKGKYLVLIEGEHTEGSAARKLVKSCQLLGVDDTALDRIIVIARKAVRIGSPVWADVVALVQAGLVSDIALDTLARCAPAEANDEGEQVAIFEALANAIDSAPSDEDKPTIWIVAHTRKGGADDVEDVSGSTQRAGQVDSVLMLSPEKVGGRVVSTLVTFAKLREEPELYPEPISFSIAPGPTGRPRIVTSNMAPDEEEPLETRVLNRLALGPRTKNRLATDLARSKADIDEALTVLFQEHRIRTETITVRGREFKAFALRPADQVSRTSTPDFSPDSHHRTPSRDEHGTNREPA